MQKTKNKIMISAIYLILFAVYNVVIFLLFRNHNNVFWISYIFMVIAFSFQIITVLNLFNKSGVESIFFGIPIASLSIYYFLAELFCSLCFMIFKNSNITFCIIIQLLLLTAFIVITIIATMSRNAIEEINDNVKINVSNLKAKNIDVEILMEGITDPILKEKLRKLSETIKYSDPMINTSIENVNQRIDQKLNELRIYIESNEIEEAKTSCTQLERLYLERNKVLKNSK